MEDKWLDCIDFSGKNRKDFKTAQLKLNVQAHLHFNFEAILFFKHS